MAKRFTDTEKWKDPWFCSLSEKEKLFWLYLIDNCDHAGIWRANWTLVTFYIPGFQYNHKSFKDRIHVINDEKWFIPKFLKYQYPNGLTGDWKVARSVICILKEYNLLETLEKQYGYSINTVQVKVKVKAMVKAKAMVNEKYNKKSASFTPPTLQQVTDYCSERKNTINPQMFLDHYEANGWMRGKTKMKDWKACIRTWEGRESSSHKPPSSNYDLWEKNASPSCKNCRGTGKIYAPGSGTYGKCGCVKI